LLPEKYLTLQKKDMHLFYDKDISGDFHVLGDEESRHCTKVLRLVIGDQVFLTDGLGNFYTTVIAESHQKKTILKITNCEKEFGKRSYRIHLAVAPTKMNERFEWFIEKATEIGVDEISPIICKNSERKIIKTDRLNRIAEAAMKQSYKAYHPIINEAIDFAKFIKQTHNYDQKFIAHSDDYSGDNFLGKAIQMQSSYLILIGPEGDFTKDELLLAKAAGFIEIGLGNSRLRTETAAVVACNIVSTVNCLG
jgi:16S rRNA (uracil1498-N3)-methyltransferase